MPPVLRPTAWLASLAFGLAGQDRTRANSPATAVRPHGHGTRCGGWRKHRPIQPVFVGAAKPARPEFRSGTGLDLDRIRSRRQFDILTTGDHFQPHAPALA